VEVKVACWADSEMTRINRGVTKISPIAYRTAPYAYWKLLIADEDAKIKKGVIKFVKIKKVSIPGNTLVSPLCIMRHGYGVVLDTYETCPPRTRVEEPKTINMVAFLPVRDGEIKKGDMLGVIKVFVVGVGPIEAMSKVRAADERLDLDEYDVNLVYVEDDEIKRERVKVREYMYRRRHLAEWLPLVADEDVKLRAGEVVTVKIKDVLISSETIPVPLSIMRHAYGVVVDVIQLGKPKKVEEVKTVTHAVFIPVADEEIKKGDLIGVLNVYYISLKEGTYFAAPLPTERATLVFRQNGEVVRREIELKQFGYKRSAIGRLEPLIARETKKVKNNEVTAIKVDAINLPAGTVVQPLYGRNHAIGIVLDVTSPERPKKVEDDKKIDFVVFLPVSDGVVEEGDLIGVLNIYHVAVLGLDMILYT